MAETVHFKPGAVRDHRVARLLVKEQLRLILLEAAKDGGVSLPAPIDSMTWHVDGTGAFVYATLEMAPELRAKLTAAMDRLSPQDNAQREKCAEGVPMYLYTPPSPRRR